ncbi:MAG: T9SS type A sorting domain-containing protein [Bacteroidetes bacterium]|nr:T9SS type A sorting domain-containing protein [Bacteroidota bacterium]
MTNLKIDTCIVWNHSISSYTNSDVVEAGILNFKLLRFGSFDYGQVLMSNGYMELLYLKTDSCTYLNKINVLALASQDLQKKSDNITLYPNPVQELLNVSVKNPDTKIEKISIINLAGQTITDFYSNETKYNLNNIKAGLYIIEISTNKGKFRQKITKF